MVRNLGCFAYIETNNWNKIDGIMLFFFFVRNDKVLPHNTISLSSSPTNDAILSKEEQ